MNKSAKIINHTLLVVFFVIICIAYFLTTAQVSYAYDVVASGDYNEISWTLDSDGTLTISGSGNTPSNKPNSPHTPWHEYKDSIKKVVVIPEANKTIVLHYYCFYDCKNLQTVEVRNRSIELLSHAFDGCINLKNIVGDGGITLGGPGIFYGCSSLTDIGNKVFYSVSDNGNGAMIGDEMFSGCSSLKSIPLNSSLTAIGKQAFKGCTSLENITIPDKVTTIYDYAFSGCTNLKKVNMGASLKWIEKGAFYGCNSLTDITFKRDLNSIHEYAFYGCSSLKSFDIPNVSVIYDNTFRNCTSLEQVTISDGIWKIEDYAFYGCTSLKSVVVPDSVNTFGVWVFDKNTIINCNEGSYAQAYAINNHLSYDPIEGHSWGEPEYNWSADYSTCTATHVCIHNDEHKESETVITTSVISKNASYTENGETTYTAVFSNEAFTTQTITVDNIPKLSNNTNNKPSAVSTNESMLAANNGILDPTLPKVKISTPKAAKKSMTAKWKKLNKKQQKKVKGIEVEYSLTKDFKDPKFKTTGKKKANVKIKKLLSKKTYYVRAHTYVIRNGQKYVSNWSKTKKVKIR